MALRKNVTQEVKKIIFDMPAGSDLPLRLEKISQQTGLSHFNLIQKWILQEESLVGLMLHRKERAAQAGVSRKTATRKPSGATQQAAKIVPESQNYRKTLVKRAKKLKKEGMTLKKIAETFNEEKVSTVSGTGKWHTSSINWLLNVMK